MPSPQRWYASWSPPVLFCSGEGWLRACAAEGFKRSQWANPIDSKKEGLSGSAFTQVTSIPQKFYQEILQVILNLETSPQKKTGQQFRQKRPNLLHVWRLGSTRICFFFSDFSRYLVAESWLGAAISALQGAVPADRRGTAQADGLAELGKGARVCRRSTWKNWKKKQKNRLITVYYVYLLTVL